MLDNLDLTHMNGRVYDPRVGRFISADPYIDGALDTQGWNRYAYVKNNPLSAYDPSGFGQEDAGGDCTDSPGPEAHISDPGHCGSGTSGGSGGGWNDTFEEVVVHSSRIWDGGGSIENVTVSAARGGGLNPLPIDFSNPGSGGGGGSPGRGGGSAVGGMQGQKPGTCPNTAGNYAKQFVNDTASTILGIADAFSFGYYTKMTESLGLGTVNHDLAYNAGLYGTAAISGGHLLYAGAASAIRYVPGISAADAVATRNTLKGVFSTLGADHPRAYSIGDLMAKYGSEAEVIKAASRTNASLNTAAAELGYSSASQRGVSGCP